MPAFAESGWKSGAISAIKPGTSMIAAGMPMKIKATTSKVYTKISAERSGSKAKGNIYA